MSAQSIKKPNPQAVKGTVQERVTALRQAAEQTVGAAAEAYQQKSAQLVAEEGQLVAGAQEELEQGFQKSDQRVADQAQVVTDADAEIKRLQQLLAQAKTKKAEAKSGLKTVKKEESRTKKSLTQAFNEKADTIQSEYAAKDNEARRELDEVSAAEYGKVSAAQKAGNEEIREEQRALREYKIYRAKSEIVSIEHGVAEMFKRAGEIFKEGYEKDSGVKVPERLQNRVEATAETGSANDNAPADQDRPANNSQGPQAPGL